MFLHKLGPALTKILWSGRIRQEKQRIWIQPPKKKDPDPQSLIQVIQYELQGIGKIGDKKREREIGKECVWERECYK